MLLLSSITPKYVKAVLAILFSSTERMKLPFLNWSRWSVQFKASVLVCTLSTKKQQQKNNWLWWIIIWCGRLVVYYLYYFFLSKLHLLFLTQVGESVSSVHPFYFLWNIIVILFMYVTYFVTFVFAPVHNIFGFYLYKKKSYVIALHPAPVWLQPITSITCFKTFSI